ncbi:hypothetical protein DICPUDRAFT_148293 [Dictyostelium purpureum]|uniref:SUEL-type lectin domain-containing protein n=1 Tax=Dictyostelium purpureum TaxID=5786 RepID=F0ZAR2_DICPU|nr:uncharacterized protein DICPUDRAFT_148293 [Dictyostelium purpureum]EGC38966.1 hypothetical protein DICPUDRAFT_148293 [Dictyostelium purpureum]|eukprot:XP_003284531.1 hypothetical protein DICPUDRAFT_148293 [Dictyostelium purpureum]
MKLFFLVLLIIFNSSIIHSFKINFNEHNNNNNSGKYVYKQNFQPRDTKCQNQVIGEAYVVTGECSVGRLYECIKGNTAISFKSWINVNCTGEPISHNQIPVNTCTKDDQTLYSCVDSLNLPTSNSIINIISNDCDWKNSAIEFDITYTNICQENVYPWEFSCNQTVMETKIYKTNNGTCTGAPNEVSFTNISQCKENPAHKKLNFICNE